MRIVSNHRKPSAELVRMAGMFGGRGVAADLGCGNGRDSEVLKASGFREVRSFDICPGYGEHIDLDTDRIPMEDGSASFVLMSNVLVFLDYPKGVYNALTEADRITEEGGTLVARISPSKSVYGDEAHALSLSLMKETVVFLEERGWVSKNKSLRTRILKKERENGKTERCQGSENPGIQGHTFRGIQPSSENKRRGGRHSG